MQDVDLDDIEVVILVIAKSPNKISSAANFLSRRGWPTTVMSNLSQAIEFSSEKKPDFVLVSINHPNPAISKFSDLLSTTFGTTCVAFAENLDNTSASRLSKNLLPLKIQGQASGPNLHRGLRKILAEKLNIQLDDRGQSQERANSADRSIPVKHSNAVDGQTIVQKNEPGLTQNKGPTMIKGEDLDQSGPNRFESESISTGKYTMTKKNRRSLKDLSRNPLDKPGDVVMGESAAVAEKLKKSLFGDSPGSENSDSEIDDEDTTANKLTAADDKVDGDDSITTRRSAMGKHGQTSAQNDPGGSTSNGQQFSQSKKGSSHDQAGGHTGAVGHPGYKPESGTEKRGNEARGEGQTSAGNSASIISIVRRSTFDY